MMEKAAAGMVAQKSSEQVMNRSIFSPHSISPQPTNDSARTSSGLFILIFTGDLPKRVSVIPK